MLSPVECVSSQIKGPEFRFTTVKPQERQWHTFKKQSPRCESIFSRVKEDNDLQMQKRDTGHHSFIPQHENISDVDSESPASYAKFEDEKNLFKNEELDSNTQEAKLFKEGDSVRKRVRSSNVEDIPLKAALDVNLGASLTNEIKSIGSTDVIQKYKSNKIKLDYPDCIPRVLEMYDQIYKLVNNIPSGVWISAQFVIILEDENGKTLKTYHIFCGLTTDYIRLFLNKNKEIIEAPGVIPRLKVIFSDSESGYIKSKLKGNLFHEFKKDYFLIDLNDIPELSFDQYNYFKEENLEELNDLYAPNLESKPTRGIDKIPSKLTILSSEDDGIDPNEMGVVAISLLEKQNLEDEFDRVNDSNECKSQSCLIERQNEITLRSEGEIEKAENASVDGGNKYGASIFQKDLIQDEEKLIMKQGLTVVIDIEMTRVKVLLWKIDHEVTEEIESIINKHLDWYHAKFDIVLRKMFETFGTKISQEISEANEKYTGSVVRSSKHSVTSEGNESADSNEKPESNTFKMLNDEPLYAFKQKWEEDITNSKTKWSAISKTKLIKVFTSMIEDDNDQYKKLHALKLIQLMQQETEQTDLAYYQECKMCLKDYVEKYILMEEPQEDDEESELNYST